MPKEKHKHIHVLGIESSCDDTGVAIVAEDGSILANAIHSPIKDNLVLGGVIPVIAKESHLLNIDRVAHQAFRESGLKSVASDIDAIAVTTRPGLDFSLKVGLNYGRSLAKKYNKPLIPIHHMQAHALMPLLENKAVKFPFLALLLSGGHCLLAIARRYNDFEIFGSTLDDAPGDLLDKVARRCKLRNLGPPFDVISGGAAIELLSKREDANRFKYFRGDAPMHVHKSCDFSFSGYRGHFDSYHPVIDALWEQGDRDALMRELGHICSSLQRAILIQLARKLQRAIFYYRFFWRYENISSFADSQNTSHLGFSLRNFEEDIEKDECIDVVVSGGVSANQYLVDGIRLACSEGMGTNNRVFVPSRSLCSDNGLMVAWNGMLRYKDYLERGGCNEKGCDLDQSVVVGVDLMDSISVSPKRPVGIDISAMVRSKHLRLAKLKSKEFRILENHTASPKDINSKVN